MLFKRKAVSAWAEEEPAAEAAAPLPRQKEKLGWFEKRERRRRRRIVFEEVLGWILVPAFLYLAWLGYQAIGGVPREIVDFVQELIGLALKAI